MNILLSKEKNTMILTFVLVPGYLVELFCLLFVFGARYLWFVKKLCTVILFLKRQSLTSNLLCSPGPEFMANLLLQPFKCCVYSHVWLYKYYDSICKVCLFFKLIQNLGNIAASASFMKRINQTPISALCSKNLFSTSFRCRGCMNQTQN